MKWLFSLLLTVLGGLSPAQQQSSTVPSADTAQAERRVVFENISVMLFYGRDVKPSAPVIKDYSSLYVQSKASGKTKALTSNLFGSNPTFSEAVATKDGHLAYIVALVQTASKPVNQEAMLFWFNLDENKAERIFSDHQLAGSGFSYLALAPDEKSLAFLRGDYREPSRAYQFILGNYGGKGRGSPYGVSSKLVAIKLDRQIPNGIPCFDQHSRPTTCPRTK